MPAAPTKPVIWMGDSLSILRGLPPPVQDEIGYALYVAQVVGKHINAKPLKSVGPSVLEIVSDHRGDTFRAVYAVRFPAAIW